MHTKMLVIAAAMVAMATHAFAQDRAARAVYEAAAVIPTGIVGVRTFPEPPAAFDALRASSVALAQYGLPPRPGDPQALAAWMAAMAAHPRKSRETPRVMPFRAGPAKIAPWTGGSVRGSTASSENWSGTVALLSLGSYGPGSFKEVVGESIVPTAQQAFAPGGSTLCNGGGIAVGWVGIDGWDTSDVLQGGWESSNVCDGGPTFNSYCAWAEWYPDPLFCMFNVNPGDVIYKEVWNTSATQGYAYVLDKTTNTYQTVALSCPSCVLVGNSAEWVVERPWQNGNYVQLMNYVTALMALGSAETFGKVRYGANDMKAPPVNVSMIEADASGNSETVSTATKSGWAALIFNDAGCALNGGC